MMGSSDNGSGSGRSLLPHHVEMLALSAISGTIARERGYFSVSDKKQLTGMFGPSQRLAPGLVIPVMNVYRETVFYQLRPDSPRVVDGRVRKYETPAKVKMALDVLPSTQNHIHDPKVTLWITEGIRKGDALASIGLRAVTLLGVWNWRGKNHENGAAALPDWEVIALNGRKVVICFDSDAFENPGVHKATERLGRWLESRGAELRFVYLPHGDDGSKLGVDDYLATHDRDELLACIETEWHPLPSQARQQNNSRPSIPAPETMELLGTVGKLIRRFVILPSPASYLTVALFVVHTWAFDAAHATPYLVVESPEKQSGKTRLLEVLELVCRNPLKVASITAAALFQSVDGLHPTLLIDEADAIFAGNSERNEDLRAVLNAGNAAGSVVIRGGKDGSPLTYEVFCPKVIAGIATGKLPDTVRDRAIIVPIDRKLRSEQVQRLRRRRLQDEVDALRDELRAWADEHQQALSNYDLPEPLERISDRMEEAWEPLLAIADLAGEEIATKARAAAEGLAESTEDDATAAHALLMALKDVFTDQDPASSKDIVAALNENEELPFGAWNDGKGINSRRVAQLLKRYRIKPRKVRLPGVSSVVQGYRKEQCIDAWERYGAVSNGTSGTTPVNAGDSGVFASGTNPPETPFVPDSKSAQNPRPIRDVPDVPDKSGEIHTHNDATPDEDALFDRLSSEHREVFSDG